MQTSAELRGVVERFVAGASQPALLDPGEEPLRLIPEQWTVSEWNGRLLLQAWDAKRNLVRKVVSLKEQKRDRLLFVTERFPKLEGELQMADLGAPLGQELERRSSRLAFRDRFRLMLAREFAEWRVEEISAEINLEQSLPPTFIRAFLKRGMSKGSGGMPSGAMAAMAAPPGSECSGMVAFGLIWLDYLRRREKLLTIPRLLLYVPASRELEVAARVSLLDTTKVQCTIYVFDEKDRVAALDGGDAGNLDSTLPPCRRPLSPNSEPPDFPELPGVDLIQQSDGSIGFQVRGLEFARWGGRHGSGGALMCGIGRRRRCSLETLAAMAAEVVRVRRGDTDDTLHPLYTQFPEGWLESQVRARPQAIDASLLPAPVYGQVPLFGAPDRGVIDLLGVDHTGRLVLIEIKASADLQLPFQAIDYWLRVRKHLWAGDFERLGYFSGVPLRRQEPRVLLVAPALEFHSTSETILGSLSPRLEITRVGLAADWRRELRVMFRLQGAEHPSMAHP